MDDVGRAEALSGVGWQVPREDREIEVMRAKKGKRLKGMSGCSHSPSCLTKCPLMTLELFNDVDKQLLFR